jgi:hypothetical protein
MGRERAVGRGDLGAQGIDLVGQSEVSEGNAVTRTSARRGPCRFG